MCTQNTQILFDLIFNFDMSLHKYIRLSVVHRFLSNAVRRPMSVFINLCPRTNISVSPNPYESIHIHTYVRHLADWFEDFMLYLRWIVLFKASNVKFNNQISHGSNSPGTKQNATVPIYISLRAPFPSTWPVQTRFLLIYGRHFPVPFFIRFNLFKFIFIKWLFFFILIFLWTTFSYNSCFLLVHFFLLSASSIFFLSSFSPIINLGCWVFFF